MVNSSQDVWIKPAPRFVSRGGEKLQHAIETFGLDLDAAVVLDVGASTGGFTDCALQAGASRVYAVDAGRGQLHSRLVGDARVIGMERTNARLGFELPESVDLIVIDVSFISLRLILPAVLGHLVPGGTMVVLFKPQFEAEREEVGPGGVLRDPAVRNTVLQRFLDWAASSGLSVLGIADSPVAGDKGNLEFLIQLEPKRS